VIFFEAHTEKREIKINWHEIETKSVLDFKGFADMYEKMSLVFAYTSFKLIFI
jgi:hypothetical protein